MSHQFGVNPEHLRSHASTVEGIKGKADTALDAANQVRTQAFDMAYGVLCQPFPQAMRPVEEKAVETIQDTVKALQVMTESLRKTAEHYQQVDDEHASEIGRIQGMFDAPGPR